MSKQTSFIMVLCLVLLAVCVVRVRLAATPLERDEGEYAYSGQLLLHGVPPFAQAYNMKMPGIYAAYAGVLAVFGQTATGIHLGLVLINLLCSVALFLIGKRLSGPAAGCAAAASFSLMSLSSSVLGLSANAEHFVVLFALWGLVLLLRDLDKNDNRLLFASGLLLGACVLMKQHGAAFVLFALFLVAFDACAGRPVAWKKLLFRCCVFCLGAGLPFVALCLWLRQAHVFGVFWFWTFTYAHAYVSQVPLLQGVRFFGETLKPIVVVFPLVWVLAFGGWMTLLTEKTSYAKRLFAAAFAIASFCAICPGLFFRQHYFVLLLPAVCLLCGIGLDSLCSFAARKRQRKNAFALVFLGALAASVAWFFYWERALLFQLTPVQVSRSIYGSNPFPESCVIADSLKSWTKPSDKIAVMGSEPQIFFYADRRSATGFVYTYALMENHGFAKAMQMTMEREIEAAGPQYIVFVNVPTSWLLQPRSQTGIFPWFDRYQRANYDIAGVADIVSFDKTVYVWGADAATYTPRASCWLAVFKKKRAPSAAAG
jgi:hypothetical protein